MDVFYCKTPDGNFGDDMNTWFWDHLVPGRASLDPDRTLFGIGTIITKKNLAGVSRAVIAGSGAGYGRLASLESDRIDIAWVRGPRTAQMLGMEASAAITDPAGAVSRIGLFDRKPQPGRRLFIPHRITAGLALDWDRIGAGSGLTVVSPKRDAKEVIGEIAGAELVVAESMHGAIIADAFRVPWIPIAISHHFNEFKWRDWAESMEVELSINTALTEARAAYFALRRGMGALRRVLRSARRQGGGGAEGGGKVDFSNPDYMEADERRFVKRAVAALHGPVERLLIRDLRRALSSRPQLSADATFDDRAGRVIEAGQAIARRYAA